MDAYTAVQNRFGQTVFFLLEPVSLHCQGFDCYFDSYCETKYAIMEIHF